MNRLLAITLLILTFALSSAAQKTCDRYSPAGRGFSICPPAGWRSVDGKEPNSKVMLGPTSNVFVANMNFREEATALSLKDYVDASVDYILATFNKPDNTTGVTRVKLKSRTDFVTQRNLIGIKVVFLDDLKGLLINSTQYYFDTGNKKVVVTCTALESEKAVNDKLFDASAKTFRID
jgi:hypothetical protein